MWARIARVGKVFGCADYGRWVGKYAIERGSGGFAGIALKEGLGGERFRGVRN
jgi:hypothetical protein